MITSKKKSGFEAKEKYKSLIDGIKTSFKDYYDFEEVTNSVVNDIIDCKKPLDDIQATFNAVASAHSIARDIAMKIPEIIGNNIVFLVTNKPGTPLLYGSVSFQISEDVRYDTLVEFLTRAVLFGCIHKYFEDSKSMKLGQGVGVLQVTSKANPEHQKTYDLGNPDDIYTLVNA